MSGYKLLRVLFALILTAAAFMTAFFVLRFTHLPKGGFVPQTFVLQSFYAVLCIALMAWFSKGRLAEFGFTLGSFRPSWSYFAWVVPALILGLARARGTRSGHGANMMGLTNLQTVVFVWFYSSICEEILTRGLLQTLLERASEASSAPRRWLNLPVVVSGLFFGAMHLMLLRLMGMAALPIVAYAAYLGLVAAHYRQKTGSLAPAILLHMLFNIAASLPAWAVVWLR